MIKTPFYFLLLVSLLTVTQASAFNQPEVLGFDAANEAAAQVFSSPALPSLDNEGNSLTPVYGTVKMEGADVDVTTTDTGANSTVYNSGEIKGEVAGLTFNHSGQGDLAFFAMAAWSRVSGDMTSIFEGRTTEVHDISAQSYIGVAGLSYRVVGTAKSFYALGLFAGPAFINAKTSVRIQQSDGKSTTVTLNPETQAAYVGMQMMFRPGLFRINPYLNILANTKFSCYQPTYEGDAYPDSQYNLCQNGDRGVTAFAGLVGVGINIGYGRFQFGLVHTGSGGDPSLKSTSLVLSFRIGL
jgi:hypothetical protein